jgi:hypothetical protein
MEEPPDITDDEYQTAAQGQIPWTAEQLQEGLDLTAMLSEMDEDELPEEIREAARSGPLAGAEGDFLGMDSMEAAKMIWLFGKYADKGYLPVFAYYLRLNRAAAFLSEHFDELVKLGLIEKSPDDEDMGKLSDGIVEALAVLPFGAAKTEDDEVTYTFSFADVVARARKA